ncbi:VOC family protein [Rhizobium straminoryzae]|uniref:VOC family protein n=1 Tax=Rhizobium straminoryzae TaxID=1387186 RepID=A0A549T6Q2_9HYPH|nr:VOC family protein [Rhizobium straminoryzae]TRL37558.1 VOC family protein [Rhizobium straminoryzae]
MTGFLGIDHPLIAVRDLDAAVERFRALGFTFAPQSRHPWGTSTCIAIMDRSLIELVSIYDETLLDSYAAGDFRFGRFVHDHLREREGIALTALNSDAAETDTALVIARGITCQGTIAFGRDVNRPDGTPDRTSTTLKILGSPEMPRLSNFICQQHRPDLIYVPQWSTHRNGAMSYSQLTIMAEKAHQHAVRERLAGLYGEQSLFVLENGFGARTGRGAYVVTDQRGVERRYGTLPGGVNPADGPCCIAAHIKVPDLDRVAAILAENAVTATIGPEDIRLPDAAAYGNVFLAFSATGMPV